jgi:membrane protein
MNARAQVQSKAADENDMRGRRQEKSGIFALGERSVRNFFSEHPMSTYAAALAYRGLFPFLFILVVLLGALGLTDSFDRAVEHAHSEASKHVPQELQPVIQQGRKQIQPLQGMIDNAQKQAGGDLLFFGVAVAMWSVSAVARTLTQALNVAYQVAETRR